MKAFSIYSHVHIWILNETIIIFKRPKGMFPFEKKTDMRHISYNVYIYIFKVVLL